MSVDIRPTPPAQDSARQNVTLQIVSVVMFTFIGYLTIGIPLAVLPGYVHDDLGYGSVLAGLVTQFQATMEAIQVDAEIKPAVKVQLLASLADAYNKTVSASKRVLPETSALATAMEVLQRLASFIRERFPQHAQAFAEVLEPFGEIIAKEIG